MPLVSRSAPTAPTQRLGRPPGSGRGRGRAHCVCRTGPRPATPGRQAVALTVPLFSRCAPTQRIGQPPGSRRGRSRAQCVSRTGRRQQRLAGRRRPRPCHSSAAVHPHKEVDRPRPQAGRHIGGLHGKTHGGPSGALLFWYGGVNTTAPVAASTRAVPSGGGVKILTVMLSPSGSENSAGPGATCGPGGGAPKTGMVSGVLR